MQACRHGVNGRRSFDGQSYHEFAKWIRARSGKFVIHEVATQDRELIRTVLFSRGLTWVAFGHRGCEIVLSATRLCYLELQSHQLSVQPSISWLRIRWHYCWMRYMMEERPIRALRHRLSFSDSRHSLPELSPPSCISFAPWCKERNRFIGSYTFTCFYVCCPVQLHVYQALRFSTHVCFSVEPLPQCRLIQRSTSSTILCMCKTQ